MSDLRDFTGKNRVFTGTDAETISSGSTAERVDGTGKLRFNTTSNLMEYYTGTEWKSIDAPPIITSFTIDGGSDVTSGNIDGSAGGNATIEVKGSLFDTTGATVSFVGTSETLTPLTTTRNNSSLLTVTIARSDFDNANEPYAIKVTNGSGLSAELAGAISQDAPVTFTNAVDTTYIMFDSLRGTAIAAADLCGATDADGDTITYSITIGSLPTGLTLNTSTGEITGTADAEASDTTYTFTVQAATTDLTITRQFKITVKAPQITTYTSGSGSFSVPSGLTSVDVLVVAGGGSGAKGIPNNVSVGGGGAGGLIFRPGFTVTPGGSVPYSIGGSTADNADDNGVTGADTTFGTLTAKGGGGGGGWNGNPGQAGGSGGGGSSAENTPSIPGGTGTQPGQPGDSGTYGFGNPGGTGGPTWSNGNPGGPNTRGGGGGGAGGGGTPGNSNAAGGAGRVYSISGSPVGYAGGGGGGAGQGPGPAQHGGGAGGSPGQSPAPSGTANRGGGGGGGGVIGQTPPTQGGSGGSGVVIITF